MDIRQGEKTEDLGNGYRILQNPAYFSFGTDAVLLADFADTNKKDRVVELGTGCGIVPILLCAKGKAAHVTGIEIQSGLADMARRSVAGNALEEKIDIVCGDIRHIRRMGLFGADAVVANPPYEKVDAGVQSDRESVNIAKKEVMCRLEDVLTAAAAVLRTGGRLFMIYRTERFAELMAGMRTHRLEPKRIRLVAPRAGQAPNFALVEARKGAGAGVKFLPVLAVYKADGSYTGPLKEIYGITEER